MPVEAFINNAPTGKDKMMKLRCININNQHTRILIKYNHTLGILTASTALA